MRFRRISACLDLRGCPNRCRHCWLGVTPNGRLPASALEYVADQFRPYADGLEVFDWYREPDYGDDYRALRALCARLSDGQTPHFELVSVWRLVRDDAYAGWLSSLGLKAAQLTLFGGEETTDLYTGRRGAYREILRAIDLLIAQGIAPRIQVFVNKGNLSELEHVERLIQRLDLARRCESFGGAFSCFVHQGSCAGENEQFYDAWLTPEDLDRIPASLAAYTRMHFQKASLAEVFGRTEQSLCEALAADRSTKSLVSDSPVFYVDKDFDVYPNLSAPAPHWRLGNLKADGAKAVLETYAQSRSVAQRVRLSVPLCDLAASQGRRDSNRLFSRGDYIEWLLNRYCREIA